MQCYRQLANLLLLNHSICPAWCDVHFTLTLIIAVSVSDYLIGRCQGWWSGGTVSGLPLQCDPCYFKVNVCQHTLFSIYLVWGCWPKHFAVLTQNQIWRYMSARTNATFLLLHRSDNTNPVSWCVTIQVSLTKLSTLYLSFTTVPMVTSML